MNFFLISCKIFALVYSYLDLNYDLQLKSISFGIILLLELYAGVLLNLEINCHSYGLF